MSESFSELLDKSLSSLDMQPGTIVSGVVLDLDNDWVTVHVGLKSEGIISLDEFRNNEGNVDINVGDEVEVALDLELDVRSHAGGVRRPTPDRVAAAVVRQRGLVLTQRPMLFDFST